MSRRRAVTLFLALSVIAAVTVLAQEGPQPVVVSAPQGGPPSDAVVLFDGASLAEWTYADGSPAGWTLSEGAMVVKDGGIMTRREFGDMQLHLEFASPSPARGEGQDRGNSGVYLQGIYELQVLDSYGNETYIDGMCGAIYKQHSPLVNSSRAPGRWQTYDIIFHAPAFDSQGGIKKKATLTVLHNGVLIQDHVEIEATAGGVRDKESLRGPIFLQDHDHPVKYRNFWVREI